MLIPVFTVSLVKVIFSFGFSRYMYIVQGISLFVADKVTSYICSAY